MMKKMMMMMCCSDSRTGQCVHCIEVHKYEVRADLRPAAPSADCVYTREVTRVWCVSELRTASVREVDQLCDHGL